MCAYPWDCKGMHSFKPVESFSGFTSLPEQLGYAAPTATPWIIYISPWRLEQT